MELPDLKGKRVAIVAMGASAGFYITARCNSMDYDEVWTINAIGGVLPCDRMFMMDPPSRFLDETVAGNQTSIVAQTITSEQRVSDLQLHDRPTLPKRGAVSAPSCDGEDWQLLPQ
jgi:hypothetical protein